MLGILGVWCLGLCSADVDSGRVDLWQLPQGAIQPQAAVDSKGVVHLIYFQGDGDTGNLYYIRKAPGQAASFGPIRVNNVPGSAGEIGTVRTAQLAIGKDDRVHVVWNGLGLKGTNGYPVAYQAYTRLNAAGTAFEPQRDLITWAKGINGGGSVAADKEGNVYVTWHAMAGARDEAGRAVFVAISRDNGETFAREKQANPEPTGACGCCGMRALTDSKGILYILYRAAGENIHRDTMLLVSRDRGKTFLEKRLDPWRADTCPMSTYTLSEGKDGILAAWETRDRVYTTAIHPADLTFSKPTPVSGTSQKHPFLVSNTSGQSLLIWVEGSGWQRGGALAWQVLDRKQACLASGRRENGIPVWGLATAYARPDGGFVIVY
ncbi:MAG TPA: sialidase family protein [Chthonomonadaceae bacterium]|nr:sialidase family protein [Chthonomonadaceae bacterium]